MGILDIEFQSQVHELSCQLDQLRLTHRDTSLKFKREQQVLKRLIGSLSAACQGSDDPLSNQLRSMQQELEQQKDISSLIPRLAVLERMLKQQTSNMDKQSELLDEQVKHSGETLLRVTGLPAQLKRELRNLMSYSANKTTKNFTHATKLLSIYERSLKIVTSNSKISFSDALQTPDRMQLELLSEELQNLITELDFEGESGDLLLDIRAKLLIGVNSEVMIELALQTLKLVIEGTNCERKASEQFLDQVNSALSTNLKSTLQNVDQSQSYFEHRQQLNQELNHLVTAGKTSLQKAQDYDQLKESMTPVMAQIASLSERLIMAEEREKKLQERLEYSKNQLETVFDTTQDYRRRLEDQSQRMLQDPLTKVYNRAAFNDRLELEYRRWIRAQHHLSVVMFDIDNFKAINDSYGYTAGDKALKIIARTIRTELGDLDTVARFGGEEFILLLPEQSTVYAQDLVKNIQTKVSALPFKFRDKQITITLTAASTHFKDSDTPELVLDRLGTSISNSKNRGLRQFELI